MHSSRCEGKSKQGVGQDAKGGWTLEEWRKIGKAAVTDPRFHEELNERLSKKN